MSEMSLYEQIKAVEDLIQYIEKTLPGDIQRLNEDAESAVRTFRLNGRTEIADMVNAPHMFFINEELEKLLHRLNTADLDYLYRVRENLYKALNNN